MGNKQTAQHYDSIEDAITTSQPQKQKQAEDDAHDEETQRVGSSSSSRHDRGHCERIKNKHKPECKPLLNSKGSSGSSGGSDQCQQQEITYPYKPISNRKGISPPTTIQMTDNNYHQHTDDVDKLGTDYARCAHYRPPLSPSANTAATEFETVAVHRNHSFASAVESVFSEIRSESTNTRLENCNEADVYHTHTAWERAFPERSFALIVTMIFELPTLFLIEGGSDRLCTLIGRRKYTILIALLPLISAISGNVGLQASTLTTRAISHAQVRIDNYRNWLRKEITAAAYLGLGIGLVIACISFFMGGYSLPFALSIYTAQFMGIITAGITGTLAPLLFTFIFKRDSGKWGGPLETAVQDVIGSFAMIVVTYKIMEMFGPFDLEESDMC